MKQKLKLEILDKKTHIGKRLHGKHCLNIFTNVTILILSFNVYHILLSNTSIPSFYLEIHKIFMQHFKNKPENII